MEGAAAQIKAAARTISPRVQREKHCCKDLQSIAVPWQSHSGNRSLPECAATPSSNKTAVIYQRRLPAIGNQISCSTRLPQTHEIEHSTFANNAGLRVGQ